MATRKKLPNLKICVDNTESSDESFQGSDSSSSSDDDGTLKVCGLWSRGGLEDGEVPDEDDNDVLSIGSTQPTERRFISRSALRQNKLEYGPRIYENKGGNLVTGVDITSEEALKKSEKRAHRFGTLSNPKQPITDVDIKNLYKSLGMSIETLDQDPRGWRMEAILLRGTDNLSTEDVFGYFAEYAPKGIEWIDDFSCNVLWQDKLTPARALIKLSSACEETDRPEKIVDEQVNKPHAQGTIPTNQDKKDNPSSDSNKAIVNSTANMAVDLKQEAGEKTSVPRDSVHMTESQAEPVLNILEDDTMELDYDDNLDLNSEDPIDQALAAWEKATQNKQRTERPAKAERIKSTDAWEGMETLSEKEKNSQKVPEKEEDSSKKKTKSSGDGKAKGGQGSAVDKERGKDPLDDMEVEEGNKKSNKKSQDSNNKKEICSAEEKLRKSKASEKTTKSKSKPSNTKGKMEINEQSDSDSSSSSGSESSSSGSSSSGSTSSSDSDSGSNSSASSSGSSSSSSGNSSDGSKKKMKKTRSERENERQSKRIIKKPEAPPVPPASREKSEIPWPPGWWRLGVPHAKAKYLFLRYAMKADKKVAGAEKRSQYYVKNGNPNFGGIKGLISNSRKRRMRLTDQEKEVDDNIEDPGLPALLRKRDDGLTSGHSRLAGRLGTRGGSISKKRTVAGEDSEEENERPRLKKGKDLRDVINKDASAFHSDSVQNATPSDSDDEMDYGAELERLMADAPPMKKRFMRMHADDEEEKIQARRLASVQQESRQWQKRKLDYVDLEQEDLEEDEEENRFPQRKGWIDYDNVEDDDPFNLFGTSKKETAGGRRRSFREEDDEAEVYRHRFHREENNSSPEIGGRERNVRHRLGAPGQDLRAKLQSLTRVKNRNY